MEFYKKIKYFFFSKKSPLVLLMVFLISKYDVPESMDIEDTDLIILCNAYKGYVDLNYENVEKEDKNKEFHYKRYTIEKKFKIIEKAESLGNMKTAKLYNLDESSLRYIRKHKDEYERCQNKKKLTTLHKGAYPDSNIDREKIKYFIIDTRDNCYPFITQMIYTGICVFFPVFVCNSFFFIDFLIF